MTRILADENSARENCPQRDSGTEESGVTHPTQIYELPTIHPRARDFGNGACIRVLLDV